MKNTRYLFCIITVFISFNSFAQKDSSLSSKNSNLKITQPVIDSSKQRDAIDFLYQLIKKNAPNNSREKSRALNYSLVPAFGYSLSTGFAVDLTGNVAFYTGSSHTENLSAIDAEAIYDTKSQAIIISRSEIWAQNNNYKLVTDLRLERYPTDTYGLGATTTPATDDPIVYSYIRAYATVYKKIIPDFYWGAGYSLDYHYNIKESGTANNTVSEFKKYGATTASTSSGITFSLLFDNRRNEINPLNGGYALISYRENPVFLGSNNNWQELQMDFRRYFRFSAASNNILAFWSILEFTSGNVPYFDLPATGEDMYNNSGRGYQQERFRGKNMLYLEGEYRFGVTKNGFLGGVVFTNAESFSEYTTNRFVKIAPAAGTGLRVKINKHSNTNVCLDYAYGIYGSHGLFVNLGEVF
ncbi:MAG: Surface antigen [Mucilaginibacter sp.]|nr:Surface antigen [Mucilaginibacter sp.]MDB5015795.1 Surface antigen [Mucilaginibacter sp.]MDB5140569.1 Surface antigen [Mucilaginibacter sp.]